jgi:hypothetical protein
VVLAAVALAGCGTSRGIQNEAAVRQGVIDYLSKRTDLSLSVMQVDVTSVSFRQNEADATVSFRPKGAGAGAMSMRYTLERQGNRWVVKGRGRSNQAGAAPHGMGQPEAGKPAMGEGGSGLPPGHPPVGGPRK